MPPPSYADVYVAFVDIYEMTLKVIFLVVIFETIISDPFRLNTQVGWIILTQEG